MKPSLLIPVALGLATVIPWFGVVPRTALAEASHPPEIAFGAFKSNEENVEGPDVERTYFTVGAKRVAYGMPKGCRFSVDGSGFTLTPTEIGLEGVIHVGRSPFTPDVSLAENALTYRDAAAGSVPHGAVDVELQPPVVDPFPYNGWKSLGFAWNYTFYGRSLHKSVSYINLEVGVQIMVTMESTQAGADAVDKKARQFLSSWWVMKGEVTR